MSQFSYVVSDSMPSQINVGKSSQSMAFLAAEKQIDWDDFPALIWDGMLSDTLEKDGTKGSTLENWLIIIPEMGKIIISWWF